MMAAARFGIRCYWLFLDYAAACDRWVGYTSLGLTPFLEYMTDLQAVQ